MGSVETLQENLTDERCVQSSDPPFISFLVLNGHELQYKIYLVYYN